MTWKALGRSESKRSSSTARGATRTSRTDSPIFTGSRRRSACNRQRGGHHRQADYTRRTLRERPLRAVRAVADVPSPQRALIWALGLGAFGLAFSIRTTAASLPPLLQEFTRSSSVIAVVLGAEGLFAICLPLVIGPWSDHFHTPLGRRRPFMLVAIPPMAFCLALVAFMPNVWTTALLVFAFFFAYYLYEPPYRGLYPDVLPESVYGRSQSVQHILRG